MSTFDLRQDAPGLLRVEALQMALKFERTSTTTARISWNIPAPAAGCAAGQQAYAGLVVALDTTPASRAKIPVKGTVYTADPTANANLHAGDKIETALIVGAAYDKTTTFIDITGLKANTPYYVSGYPVDAQYRYYIEGIHAYSQDFASKGTDSTSGTQIVVLNPEVSPMGAKGSDSTGLFPGVMYNFQIQLGLVPTPQNGAVDSTAFVPTPPKYTIVVDGTYAQTFDGLVLEINKQLATLNNPTTGPFAPFTNGLYWNNTTKKLYMWDGAQHVEQTTIFYPSDPSITTANTSYWYKASTGVLKRRNSADNGWDVATVVQFATDPTIPVCDVTYWYDGTVAYHWNGTVWCKPTLYSAASDPSIHIAAPCGSFWYNSTLSLLYRWNEMTNMWDSTTSIVYPTDPNAVPNGGYWFHTGTKVLYVRDTAPSPDIWTTVTNVSVSESAPTTPAPGKFWYKPTTTQLFQRDSGNTTWVEVNVIAFSSDPTNRSFCDIWWDTTADLLKVWDGVATSWATVATFYQQGIDPTLPPTLRDGDLWHNSSNGLLYAWANNCFATVPFIAWATDPRTTIGNGVVWQNGTVFKVRASGAWATISPVVCETDPDALTSGIYWFNSSNSGLQIWNGASWVLVTYSSQPLNPAANSLWFDTSTYTLKSWDLLDQMWIPATPPATVEIDSHGNLLFTHTLRGSLSFVSLKDGTLFDALTQTFTFHDTNPGTDGRSAEATYNELDIGTDGSNDERLKLMTEIRYELGYPTMDVELTVEQIDFAITRALEELRTRTSVAYKHGFFFMHINAESQRYFLTNRTQSMNKIVSILGIYRLTSSFLSSAHGSGVYGQIAMQHLYNMGNFDLLSYHLMAEYTELMEILFAARITFSWDERSRELWIHHRFQMNERMVLIEATVERTEQDIMSDRLARPWIRRFALAKSREMLAEIRGKFATLPGAGGSVSLNASELRQAAATEFELLFKDLEDAVYDRPEDYGLGGVMTLG